MGEGPVKRYSVDGAPLGHWTEIIAVARGYGYTGQAVSADATRYLTEQGHTVEEKDVADPKSKIDDTYAWCPNHPTVRYDYTKYDQCLSCEKRSKRRKRFFALCRELGYGADFVKDRAKAHFALASFNDATIEQLDWLIACGQSAVSASGLPLNIESNRYTAILIGSSWSLHRRSQEHRHGRISLRYPRESSEHAPSSSCRPAHPGGAGTRSA
jgi:hypothetical protein